MSTTLKRYGYSLFLIVTAALFLNGIGSTPQPAQATASFLVNTTTDSHDTAPGDGICADGNGDCSLRAALEETNALTGADLVTLPAGTYALTDGELTITDDLTLNGADQATTLVDGQNSSRVFLVDDFLYDHQIVVTLTHLTIQNGSVPDYGGGIFSFEILNIQDSTLLNNIASEGGGLFAGSYGTAQLTNTLISGNVVTDTGGGIDNQGILTMTNSTLVNNSAYLGGGIYNDWRITIQNTLIDGNQATYKGGGMVNAYAYQTALIDSTFQGNQATYSGGGLYNLNANSVALTRTQVLSNTAGTGGGLYNEESQVQLTESTIAFNVTIGSGGGLENTSDSVLTVSNTTVSDNHSGNRGGGLYNSGSSTAEFLNTTFSGNTATNHGGGIANNSGTVWLSQATVTANAADQDNTDGGDGGGLWDSNSSGYILFKGSLIAENLDVSGQAPNCLGEDLYSADYNLIDDLTGCTLSGVTDHNLIGLPPLLNPLDDYGGPTWTHALRTGSPAIDTGTCQDTQNAWVTTDQRGLPRPVGPACDMGAFEYPGLQLTKEVNDDFPIPGQEITYTLAVVNVLTTTVSEAVISDTLPAGLNFIGPITLQPPDAGTPGTNPPELATEVTLLPGQRITLTFAVQVNPGVPAGTVITNTAIITGPNVPATGSGTNHFIVCLDQLTVTNQADDGPGSLRHAVFAVCPGGTIDFSLPQTEILLTSGEIIIDKPLTIQGPGQDLLAVSGNHASRVFNVSAEGVTIRDLTIRDGYVFGSGGALQNTGVLTLMNTALISNTASVYIPTGGGGGGAIYNVGVITISQSTFLSNTVNSYGGGGGGLYNDGQAWVQDSLFENNSATGYYGYGGALHNAANGNTLVERSLFFANWAENSGGAFNNFDGFLTIRDSLASQNSAQNFDGGALNHADGTVIVRNTTFSDNFANNDGGALWIYSAALDLDNVTLAENTAGGEGQEIFTEYSNIDLRNTIINGHLGGGNCSDYSGWNLGSLGYNLSNDDTCGLTDPTDQPDTEPQLGPLADHGGNTLTHAPLPGSPVIDAGSCTDSEGNPVLADQRGVARPIGLDCDLGAHEFDGISLNKFVNDEFPEPGQRITYTLTLLNASILSITAGIISDTLPAGILFAGPIGLEPPGAGTVGSTPPELVSNLFLAPNQVITVTLPVTVAANTPLGTVITNTAAFTNTDQPLPIIGSRVIQVCANQVLVTNSADSGPGSLREAITNLCPGGLIAFDLATPVTILLTSGELVIDKPLTLVGPGADVLTVSGNNTSRVFNVIGDPVTLSGLTIRDGYTTEDGGGVYNAGNLTLMDVQVINNTAVQGGGFYNAAGVLTLTNTLVMQNTASDLGGGGYDMQGILSVASSTIQANQAASAGGGLYLQYGQAALSNTSILSNTATGQGGGVFSSGVLTLANSAVDWNAAAAGSSYYQGGGIYIQSGSLIFLNSTLRDNLAGHGGGLFNEFGHLTLTDCEITGNSAAGFAYGGGLYVGAPNGTHTLTNCLLQDNTATRGGGIYNAEGTLVISNTRILSNTAEGGGIYNNHFLTLMDTVIQGNVAPVLNYARNGGGLYNQSEGTLTLIHSAVLDNVSMQNGGGIYDEGQYLTILNSVVSGNQAEGDGGGLYRAPFLGFLTIGNSTFSGNAAAGFGGGIYHTSLQGGGIHHSTIANNYADSDNNGEGDGGGIYQPEGTAPTLLNTILADNIDMGGQAPECSGVAFYSAGYTLVEDLTGCTFNQSEGDLLGLDPLLAPLADNGGETLTHALLSDSPALNAGTCTDFSGDPVMDDQRGIARPQGNACDMGAFELDFLPATSADLAVSMAAQPDPVAPGALLTYTLSLTNSGPLTATQVVLTDTLPAGVTVIGIQGSASGNCQQTGEVISCALGTLAPGEVRHLTITVLTPLAEGWLTNLAEIAAAELDPDVTNNVVSVDTHVMTQDYQIFLPVIVR